MDSAILAERLADYAVLGYRSKATGFNIAGGHGKVIKPSAPGDGR